MTEWDMRMSKSIRVLRCDYSVTLLFYLEHLVPLHIQIFTSVHFIVCEVLLAIAH